VVADLAKAGWGLLLALGYSTRWAFASMLMVVVKVHWPKVWVTKGGFEHPLVNVAATALALTVRAGTHWTRRWTSPCPRRGRSSSG